MFYDIYKAFIKSGKMLYYTNSNLIAHNDLFKLLESYSSDRHQRVIFNGETSKWNKINAEVPPESILDPLFFLFT